MVGNASGGDGSSYQDMEASCVRTVIVGVITLVVVVGLFCLGIAKLVELLS